MENTPRRTHGERANIPRTTSRVRIVGTYVIVIALLLPVILEASIPEKTSSYEAVGSDYIALLEALNEDRRADAFRKRRSKVLASLE